MTAAFPGTATPDLWARLDGLRTFLARALDDDTRDPQMALELAEADLSALCQEAPAWCPGCVGRGAGTVCCVCGAPIPAALRLRPDGPPEARADCLDCVAGRRHVHTPGAREGGTRS